VELQLLFRTSQTVLLEVLEVQYLEYWYMRTDANENIDIIIDHSTLEPKLMPAEG
jgi:hypothetical protein